MRAAVWPRPSKSGHRMLLLDPGQRTTTDHTVGDLPAILEPGDALVLNDAATVPASLGGMTARGPVEIRLAGAIAPQEGARGAAREWQAIVFGAGAWRMRTEDRPAPPRLAVGNGIEFANGLSATVQEIAAGSPRLVQLRFDREAEALWTALYRAGKPVQYSHLCGALNLWHVQTPYAARPWAVEMPSAGFALTVPIVHALRRRGVRIATLTHAAGLSATGDPALDAMLPLPEHYEIPAATVEIVQRTRAAGRRVIAAGTTVVRALEGCAHSNGGVLRPGTGRTGLRLSAGQPLQIVRGILTGLHEPGTSHFDLLCAFAPAAALTAALNDAAAAGYLGHEFGDLALILA